MLPCSFNPLTLSYGTRRFNATSSHSENIIVQKDQRLGKLGFRWEDSIRNYHEEIGVSTRNWVDSAQNTNYWRALLKS